MKKPTFTIEKKLWQEEYIVIGIDEVGRGALAGPLTVGAACFKPSFMDTSWKKIQKLGINDSKVLSPTKREVLTPMIQRQALAYATASCTVDDINSKGVTKATCDIFNDVVQMVIKALPHNSKIFVLVDGIICPTIQNLNKNYIKTIIDGDAKSISIAAASIIAKVDRDSQMAHLAKSFSQYNWDKNKGYGTKYHILGLRSHGANYLHRKIFIDSILP